MIVELEEEDIETLADKLDVLAAGGIVVLTAEQTAAVVESDFVPVWAACCLDYLRWCARWIENERDRIRREEKHL